MQSGRDQSGQGGQKQNPSGGQSQSGQKQGMQDDE
jgi:hypothetical protein